MNISSIDVNLNCGGDNRVLVLGKIQVTDFLKYLGFPYDDFENRTNGFD